MLSFNQKIALRIAISSILIAIVLGIASWFLAFSAAEELNKAITIETAQHLTERDVAFSSNQYIFPEEADRAVKILVRYGIFDVVEIYSSDGNKLAEYGDAPSEVGHSMMGTHHARLLGLKGPIQTSQKLSDGRRVINTITPIFNDSDSTHSVIGYLETLHIIPLWREAQLSNVALFTALMVGLASLLCGLIVYPSIIFLTKEKDIKAEKLFKSNIQIIKSLGEAAAKRDAETGIHNYRVTLIAIKIAEALNLSHSEMVAVIIGSLLHDIGKIAIADSILLKPGKLTDEEMTIMKTHVKHGEDIIQNRTLLHEGWSIVSAHHEKWDGSGYPRGLKGNNIPYPARIFAVADVFDALCSKRPYKESFDYETTMQMMDDGRGTHFDPIVLDAFRPISKSIYDFVILNEEPIFSELDQAISKYLKQQLS